MVSLWHVCVVCVFVCVCVCVRVRVCCVLCMLVLTLMGTDLCGGGEGAYWSLVKGVLQVWLS